MVFIFTLILGTTLTKINFNSTGRKEHFYQVVPEKECIRVFKKKGEKTFADVFISDINKFSYGLSSDHLIAKYSSAQNKKANCAWLFFSIVTEKRTIDFYMEEKDLNIWYYGIKKFLEINQSTQKLFSVNSFVFKRLKMKMITQLNEELIKPNNQNNTFLLRFKNLLNNKSMFLYF